MPEPSEPQSIRRLSSVEDAQRAMPRLIGALNDDPRLARAALANPLFAIEELGYTIDEGIRTTFERRIRFRPDEAARLEGLAAEVSEAAGCEVDVDDPYDLAHVLFDVLGLPRPDANGKGEVERFNDRSSHEERSSATEPLDPRLPWVTDYRPDPLEALAGTHPVIRPLLEYRNLDASQPRLASPDRYRRARDDTSSVANVSFRRHTEPSASSPRKPRQRTK